MDASINAVVEMKDGETDAKVLKDAAVDNNTWRDCFLVDSCTTTKDETAKGTKDSEVTFHDHLQNDGFLKNAGVDATVQMHDAIATDFEQWEYFDWTTMAHYQWDVRDHPGV